MKISEMSKNTGISEYTLRYYEKKGLIKVKRDEYARREYAIEDVEWILFIKKLKDTGMALTNIKKYSDFRYMGDETLNERREMLFLHRMAILDEIMRWEQYLSNINEKIDIYNKKLK